MHKPFGFVHIVRKHWSFRTNACSRNTERSERSERSEVLPKHLNTKCLNAPTSELRSNSLTGEKRSFSPYGHKSEAFVPNSEMRSISRAKRYASLRDAIRFASKAEPTTLWVVFTPIWPNSAQQSSTQLTPQPEGLCHLPSS